VHFVGLTREIVISLLLAQRKCWLLIGVKKFNGMLFSGREVLKMFWVLGFLVIQSFIKGPSVVSPVYKYFHSLRHLKGKYLAIFIMSLVFSCAVFFLRTAVFFLRTAPQTADLQRH
jgi:hypothetical protein